MDLLATLARYGYAMRQHLQEEGWGARKLTVIDLTDDYRRALRERGLLGLQRALALHNRRCFPAVEITSPQPQESVVLARAGQIGACVIVPRDHAAYQNFARQLITAVTQRTGVQLEALDDQADPMALLQRRSLILLGGAHENRAAMGLALRIRTGFVDASVPGDDGWIVTTHAGLSGAGNAVLQIATGPEHQAAALATVLDALQQTAGDVHLRHVHRVQHGAALRARFPSWETFTANLPQTIGQLKHHHGPVPSDPVALSHLLALGLESGGREKNEYNAAPIDHTITAARYYQISGDARALTLFREMLFRLADYFLKSPNGASYPSDFDFRIGPLLLYYARLEHEPVFSDEDRLLLINLFLAYIRQVLNYTLQVWPLRPDRQARFNHPTFKALTMELGAWYFSRFGLAAEIEQWRHYPQHTFSPCLWNRHKQIENANNYESLVYHHAAAYAMFIGQPFDERMQKCLREVVRRQMITCDNFLRPVDYGDAGLHLKPLCTGLARVLATADRTPAVTWFAEEDLARHRDDLPPFLHEHPGLRQHRTPHAPPTGSWEFAPLDPEFARDFGTNLPLTQTFDKLAFRTGWGDDDHYLLWEGTGNLHVGHGHNEANGIVRLNHLGRHWIVSNGYGRRRGLTDVSQSFTTRERGPADHNMLVLHRQGKVVTDLPPCAALLQRGQQHGVLYATTALLGYGGVDWFRTLVACPGAFVLVLDRIHVLLDGLEHAHVEWNCLGDCQPANQGFVLEQKGVFMHVTSDSGWSAQQTVADESACWQTLLSSGQYPYATFPLTKLIYQPPGLTRGQTHTLTTLLTVGRTAGPSFTLAQPKAGFVRVTGDRANCSGLEHRDGDLSLRTDGMSLEIGFAPMPS